MNDRKGRPFLHGAGKMIRFIKFIFKSLLYSFLLGVVFTLSLVLDSCTLEPSLIDREKGGTYIYDCDSKAMTHVVSCGSIDYIGNCKDAYVNDATEVAQAFHCILTNEKRNHSFNVVSDMQWYDIQRFVVSLNLSDSDTLILFYAGHGTYEEKASKGLMFPISDCGINEVVDSAQVATFLEGLPCRTLLLVSSCYSGAFVDAFVESRKVCVIASASRYEVSYTAVSPRFHYHTLFAASLLDILGWNCALSLKINGMHGALKRTTTIGNTCDLFNRVYSLGSTVQWNGLRFELFGGK